MTANLTPADARAWNAALEAAAQAADYFAGLNYAAMYYPEEAGMAASSTAHEVAAAIRALSVPIPPEPDVEAVEQMIAWIKAAGMHMHGQHPEALPHWIAALTAAGMLRQP